MNEYLERSIERFRKRSAYYETTARYYSGLHNLRFATDKFTNTFGDLFREFALNLCPAIVDAVADKLKIVGFGRRTGEDNGPLECADAIWQANRMALRAGEIHREALKSGDAYAVVWPGADGRARIFPNSAASFTVFFDEEEPGRIVSAAKYWRADDGRTRLNLFFPDRIERYISKDRAEGWLPLASDLVPLPDSPVTPNPFGVVPVFHFANNSEIGTFGRSELDAAIPIQDGLNKTVLDMLVAMEVSAFRQRWAAGIELRFDKDGAPIQPFKAGVDNIWLAEDPSARFGDFATADLEQFLKVKDGFRIDLASVTGTPLYYLMPQAGAFPSGESLRKAETRFLAKVRDRQEQFGAVWGNVLEFALRVEGQPEASIHTTWEDASPETERYVLENLRIKKSLGVAIERLLREAGYGEADREATRSETSLDQDKKRSE